MLVAASSSNTVPAKLSPSLSGPPGWSASRTVVPSGPTMSIARSPTQLCWISRDRHVEVLDAAAVGHEHRRADATGVVVRDRQRDLSGGVALRAGRAHRWAARAGPSASRSPRRSTASRRTSAPQVAALARCTAKRGLLAALDVGGDRREGRAALGDGQAARAGQRRRQRADGGIGARVADLLADVRLLVGLERPVAVATRDVVEDGASTGAPAPAPAARRRSRRPARSPGRWCRRCPARRRPRSRCRARSRRSARSCRAEGRRSPRCCARRGCRRCASRRRRRRSRGRCCPPRRPRGPGC